MSTGVEERTDAMTTLLEPVAKLDREVLGLAGLVDTDQARGLVDLYYRWQEHRIALRGQIRAIMQGADPAASTDLLAHFADQVEQLERQMVRVFDEWTDTHRVGVWSKAQLGIGPVLAAGLLGHIDIERAATAGAIWRFAGLDPTVKWGKGERRPWNADLKVLCWKIGDSFVKVSGREDALYGQLYRQRKAYELERDASGGNAEAAARKLEEQKIKDKALRLRLESGHLADGQLDQRARRWAVKIFLSHWHEVAYQDFYGVAPPAPFILEHGDGHVHRIEVPAG